MLIPLLAASAPAEIVRCTVDDRPAVECRMTDALLSGDRHRLTFTAAGRRIIFVGRHRNGWWTGTLDGRPAMGYERNRGNVVIGTGDLRSRFAWWYPADEHGTY